MLMGEIQNMTTSKQKSIDGYKSFKIYDTK